MANLWNISVFTYDNYEKIRQLICVKCPFIQVGSHKTIVPPIKATSQFYTLYLNNYVFILQLTYVYTYKVKYIQILHQQSTTLQIEDMYREKATAL